MMPSSPFPQGLSSSGGVVGSGPVAIRRRNSVPSAPKEVFDMIEMVRCLCAGGFYRIIIHQDSHPHRRPPAAARHHRAAPACAHCSVPPLPSFTSRLAHPDILFSFLLRAASSSSHRRLEKATSTGQPKTRRSPSCLQTTSSIRIYEARSTRTAAAPLLHLPASGRTLACQRLLHFGH